MEPVPAATRMQRGPSLHPKFYSIPIPANIRPHLRSDTFMGCFPEVEWALTLQSHPMMCLGNSICSSNWAPICLERNLRSRTQLAPPTSSTSLRKPCSPPSPLAHATACGIGGCEPCCASLGCIPFRKWVISRISGVYPTCDWISNVCKWGISYDIKRLRFLRCTSKWWLDQGFQVTAPS